MKTNVANRACIRRLSLNHMKSAPTRNLIAVIAIALTSVLFTAIFTVAFSVVHTFQYSNFRMVGSDTHGGFKALLAEDIEEIKDDPRIKEYGLRLFLGTSSQAPLNKNIVDVSYKDAYEAEHSFVIPTTGRLPEEGTNEAATDTMVLSLLGVPAKIGAQFTLPIDVNGIEVTETFTLSGYWEYDDAIYTNDILLPKSRVEQILNDNDITPTNSTGFAGLWFMSVMLKNASHIEEALNDILTDHGYATGMIAGMRDANGRPYPAIGVNWGYLTSQFEGQVDPVSAIGLVLVLTIILFTGYLIIYNVFQISVAGDIRFYGLLKTIGATGRQLRRLISLQALLLSCIGIPLGLAAGYGIGALLLPGIIGSITTETAGHSMLSASPLLFLGAAVFALLTVCISCRKPGRMAAKVSPIEAVRYTENNAGTHHGRLYRLLHHGKISAHTNRIPASGRKKYARTQKGASLSAMALANLGRSKKRTAVTLFSLSLAVLVLNFTVTFTGGFDMEKYVSRTIVTDFHVADAAYYNPGSHSYTEQMAVSDDLIEQINAQEGVTGGGRTYGELWSDASVYHVVDTPEEFWRLNQDLLQYLPTEEYRQSYIDFHRDEQGRYQDSVQLYGMEPFCLEQLTVLDGDLSKLATQDNAVAAVYLTGDYGEILDSSNAYTVGDTLLIHYDEYEYRDAATGQLLSAEEKNQYMDSGLPYDYSVKAQKEIEYEVVATVAIPNALSYRFFGSKEFVMSAETFARDTDTANAMYYVFDVDEAHRSAMDDFLADYTQNEGSRYNYESRQTTEQEFSSLRDMFLFAGSALSFIIGMIGVLNFFNTILTGILARHREFAVLQSVGMTGGQLKGMLIREGVLYAAFTVLLSFALVLVTAPFMASLLGSTFWFFTYRFTILPAAAAAPVFVLLGVLLPLIVYRFTSGRSVVERLRETE